MMSMTYIRNIIVRLKILITRKITWVGKDNQSECVEKTTLSGAWALAGIHSSNWRWVKKYGKMECGCTRNPITRRIVLFWVGCGTHCPEFVETIMKRKINEK